MAETNKNDKYYLTEQGFYTYGDIIKSGYVPFFCIECVKNSRKIYSIITDKYSQFNLESDKRLKHRSLYDANGSVMKSVFFVGAEDYERFAVFMQKANFKQEIAPYFKECGMINVIYDYDNIDLKQAQIVQIVEKAEEDLKPEATEIKADKSVKNPAHNHTKGARPKQKTKKQVKKVAKPKVGRTYRDWGITMPPLPENATAEQRKQRKQEYHKLLRQKKKEAEQAYILSLSEEEREKYLADKKAKSSKKYYENKAKKEEKFANLTEDEIKQEKDKENMYRRNWYANSKKREEEMLAGMTEEERESYLSAKRKKYRDRVAKTYENRTEEERQFYLEKHREASKRSYQKRIANMTEEEYNDFIQKRREKERQKLANMTEEEYKVYIEKRRERERKKATRKRELKKQKELEKTQ